jgi:TrmH family RNA methyltransferase
VKHIESRSNPSFKSLLALAGDAREQRQSGRTLIDGAHLVGAYQEKVGAVERLLVSESGRAKAEIAALLEASPTTEITVLRDALFRELSGLASPSGIAAVIAVPAETDARAEGSCVLLDAVQDAGNVGSILRSAAAAGIRDVFLGSGCAGAWTPRVLRAGQGAHFDLRLRERCDLALLLGRYPGVVAAAVAKGGRSLFDLDLRGRSVAWIFGNEGTGIRAELLALAQHRVEIPMAPGSESLNVAAAAAICFFEGVRQGLAGVRPL